MIYPNWTEAQAKEILNLSWLNL